MEPGLNANKPIPKSEPNSTRTSEQSHQTTTASGVLLHKHFSDLPLALHLRDREPAFRALCIRFLFTEFSICQLPYDVNTSFIGSSAQAPTGHVQTPNSYTTSGLPIVSAPNFPTRHALSSTRRAMELQAVSKFIEKFGMQLWGLRKLTGWYWKALEGYFVVLLSVEAKDEVWREFWEGRDEDKDDYDGILRQGMRRHSI